MTAVIRDSHGHRKEWITCKTCGKSALVKVGGKGFCSKKCIRGVNLGQKHAWKGDDAGYSGFHRRVYRARGKADHCSRCGKTDPSLRYEWANLTGNYPDPNDYAPMCVPCHRAYDAGARPSGSKHPNARLTEDIVRDARRRFAAGPGIKSLAIEAGVSWMTMARAVRGETWAHVKD